MWAGLKPDAFGLRSCCVVKWLPASYDLAPDVVANSQLVRNPVQNIRRRVPAAHRFNWLDRVRLPARFSTPETLIFRETRVG